MDLRKRWELLKELLPTSNKGRIILAVVAFFLAAIVIPTIILWFIVPVEKFINSKAKSWAFIAIVMILTTAIFAHIPTVDEIESSKAITGYTRIWTIVGENYYEMFAPIQVVKNEKSDLWNVYKEGKKIGQIKKADIVFEGTPEYEQTKKEKEKADRLAAEAKKQQEEKEKAAKAKLEKERAKQIAEFEKIIKKAFYKVELEQFSKDGNGIYKFYVDPYAWAQLPFDQKEGLFKSCTVYVQLKTNGTEPSYAKVGTKIKSASNGAVLAEYDPFGGIKLK